MPTCFLRNAVPEAFSKMEEPIGRQHLQTEAVRNAAKNIQTDRPIVDQNNVVKSGHAVYAS